jgi:hypothetical protein
MLGMTPHRQVVLKEEFGGFSFRRCLLRFMEGFIPSEMGSRMRASLPTLS